MACTRPISGWLSKTKTKAGKRTVVFDAKEGLVDMPTTIPCGQCTGCRLEKSRQWAMRMMHEASEHEQSIFVTLTYNEENEPLDGGLDKTHFQKFMKRLRKHNQDKRIRYYHSGEYGDDTNRPHYHAALFGIWFDDSIPIPGKKGLYTSETLEKIWGMGFVTIGNLTFESAAYVARYIMKKQTGKEEKQYETLDPIDGQLYSVQAPYATMSRKPGIGKTWYDKYKGDCFPSDFLIVNGKKVKPPTYYVDQLEKEEPEQYKHLKFNRAKSAKTNYKNTTSQRLKAKEKLQSTRIENHKRRNVQ